MRRTGPRDSSGAVVSVGVEPRSPGVSRETFEREEGRVVKVFVQITVDPCPVCGAYETATAEMVGAGKFRAKCLVRDEKYDVEVEE